MTNKLLLIDDDPSIHSLIKTFFHPSRYEVISAFDGKSGIQAAARHNPDVILLDIEMPTVGGHEVCRRLKADRSSQRIPVIFLSASGTIEHQVSGLDGGASDYVIKPFHPEELRARVRAALRSRSEMNRQLEHSMIDELTELFDRNYFDLRMGTELEIARRSGRTLGCVLVDIDGMGAINDAVGLPMGDNVLRAAAQSIREICRPQDVVCRFEQDKFGVLVGETSARSLEDFSDRARLAVRCGAPVLPRCDLQVTVSVGFGLSRTAGLSIFAEALDALDRSKSAGGDRVTAGRKLTQLQMAS